MIDLITKFFDWRVPHLGLVDDIAAAFTRHYPCTAEDVKKAYDLLKSWDMVECLCEFMIAYGYTSPYHCIGVLMDTFDGRRFQRLWFGDRLQSIKAPRYAEPKPALDTPGESG